MDQTLDHTLIIVFQVLGFIVGPIVLGLFIYFGVRHTWMRKPAAVQQLQNRGTEQVYADAERERERKAKAAQRSSDPIDVVERKTDTTG
jgi:hypothetical protein